MTTEVQTIDAWIAAHHATKANVGQRLGQAFVNQFISQPMPDLFYERNDKAAEAVIRQWMVDHQYYNTLPPKRK